jgi:hypothetical protein
MNQVSIAGQLASQLEAALARAGRLGGLASMPASGATCFFEDPLGPLLGDAAPRCPPSPHPPKEHQPLWSALCKGSVAAAGSGRDLHFYEVLGNGTGDRESRQRHMARAAQWVFLHWLHWYQRPTERYATFRHVVLLKTVAQNAPFRRIWSGYLYTLRDLAMATQGHADCPLPRMPSKSEKSFTHRFDSEPAWVDALGRLATRHEAASQHITAAQLLGSDEAARSVPDWSWAAPPSARANLMTVSAKRCSPSAFAILLDALRFDRWLALHARIDLQQLSQSAMVHGSDEVHMNAQEAREQAVQDMSHRMSLPRTATPGGMRYADAATAADARAAPQKARDPAVERLLNAPLWDPEFRLLSNELDPSAPEVLSLSVMHEEFLEQFADPALGVLIDLEVKEGDSIRRSFAVSYDYEPPQPGGPRGRGKLLLEIHDVQRLGFFATQLVRADGASRWTWEADAALVPATGEPVILLRITL